MLNQWPKESLLKLKEIIREQQAKQNARDMADREREKSSGCGEAMIQALKLNGWADLDKMHSKFCPQLQHNDLSCINGCVFSCVPEDIGMMAEVLRTLEVVNESSK